MKESEKLEACGGGLNLKSVVGLTLQSSLMEIREWTPELRETLTDMHIDNEILQYLSCENFCILNVILDTEFGIIHCISQIIASK